MSKSKWLSGPKIAPEPIAKGIGAADLVDRVFLSYNAGRLQKAARLFVEKMLADDAFVGMSLTGALTPAGLGRSVIIPLIRAGFVDWIVSTGANLYHDAHFGLGLSLHQGTHEVDDRLLRAEGVVRIYDILFDYKVLLETDAYLRKVMAGPEFQKDMSSAELHHLLGKYLAAREDELKVQDTCVLSTAYRCGVPCYTSSPGDSSIGMNVAELWLKSRGPRLDVCRDVNETAAIVYEAKKSGGSSGVLIFGGGSPKNFMLQTEPQIQEVLGLDEAGHDYFVQVTDARPDTGGLSGATPGEAVSWGKVDPEKLPGTVVVYGDSTIVAPLLAAYALTRHEPRPLKRLYDRLEPMLDRLRGDYVKKTEGTASETNPESHAKR
ncbi:MAG TPA: deoxyhypusine synthase [Candidatus Polarisedimenticolaceae bacterium]|nr:deoxyhypusine synthase [Candidatus Polarisedimenticolaceae bacterium]